METGKKKNMYYFNEDLLLIILARLPIKSITAFKSVCKQWKSIIESQYLYDFFMSYHQNSHSSWSLMCRETEKEVVAHYGCETWGVTQSLGSYISSFITKKFEAKKEHVKVEAYTDVGLILISIANMMISWGYDLTFYVANPISRQCVEIPAFKFFRPSKSFKPSGLATRTENGVVLGYKVVMLEIQTNTDFISQTNTDFIKLLIYSSETGFWSFNTLQSSLPLHRVSWFNPVSLNGSLYWLDDEKAIVSHDFYGTESDRCRVIPFPDLEKDVSFKRACTTSQGSLLYMNIVNEEKDDVGIEHKLCVWRLNSEEWQLVSEISPSRIKTGTDYFPLAMNPFDADNMYLWSEKYTCLASTNLHKGKFVLHKNLVEHSSDGRVLSSAGDWNPFECCFDPQFSRFALPRWLHRIPSSPT